MVPVVSGYTPRSPAGSLVQQALREHLGELLQEGAAGPLPAHVERELVGARDCGVLERGAVCLRCEDCGRRRFVGFSCKGRGSCGSGCGRRMSETAEHLCERVLPDVPVRQVVLTLPPWLRWLVLRQPGLLSEVRRELVRGAFALWRQLARRRGRREARCGAVVVTQRFGDGLRLHTHLHMLLLDGVYVMEGPERRFVPLEPGPGDIAWLALRIRRRLLRRLGRQGLAPEDDCDEGGDEDERRQSWLEGTAVQGRIALGPRAGWRVERLGGEEVRLAPLGVLCAEAEGFNVHAGVRVIAGRRERLRALCRYLLRPPLSEERLAQLADGRILVRLKRPWSDGTRALRFEPLDFLSKLAAQVPPPRRHLVVYAGVLSAHARDRGQIVPDEQSAAGVCGCAAAQGTGSVPGASPAAQRRANRLKWAELLRRTFALDVLRCECGGRMRLLCSVTDPEALAAIARSLGRTTPPPRPPPRQGELFTEPA